MAGAKASKTARASTNAGARNSNKGGYERPAGTDRLIITGAGRFAYVFQVDGRTAHLRVGSDAFNAAVADLLALPRDADHVRGELAAAEAKYPGLGFGALLVDDTADSDVAAAA